MKAKFSRRGVGLIEALVASLLIVLAAVESTYTFLASEKTVSDAGHRIEAVNYSQATLEDLTAKGFSAAELANDVTDVPHPLPAGELSSTFNGERTYSVENIKDDITGEFAYKKITAKTSWSSGGKPPQSVVLVTLLSNPAKYSVFLPPMVSFSADPYTINAGAYSLLQWSSSNANFTRFSDISGDFAVSGSRLVYPPITTTYTITAYGDGGKITASVTVTVVVPITTTTISSPSTTTEHSSTTTEHSSTTTEHSSTTTEHSTTTTEHSSTTTEHSTTTTSPSTTTTTTGGCHEVCGACEYDFSTGHWSFSTRCFLAGTKVLIQGGLKNIEEIKKNDLVLTRNETTGSNEYKKVLNTTSTTRTGIIELTLDNDVVLICSRNHRFYIENKGWTQADNLSLSDPLVTQDGKRMQLKAIKLMPPNQEFKVYNFDVEGNHNYFVSETGVLVHNIKICGCKTVEENEAYCESLNTGTTTSPTSTTARSSSTTTSSSTPTTTSQGGGCFISGTKIFAKGGFKKIENLTTEDEVLSYNPNTKQAEYEPVGKTWEFESKEIYEIITDKGSSIKVTSEHPFYTMRGKIKADKLKAGDTLIAVSSDMVKIAEIKIHSYDQPVKTYNLTIDDTHTFFVGEEGVLVGNVVNAEGAQVKF